VIVSRFTGIKTRRPSNLREHTACDGHVASMSVAIHSDFYRKDSEDSKASICSLTYLLRRAQGLYNRLLRRPSFDIYPFSVFRRFLRARLQHLTQGTGGLILTSSQFFSRPTCSSFRLVTRFFRRRHFRS
jgi:hypothetical protein